MQTIIQSNNECRSLNEAIDLLPKELRILVANYNVEHRVNYTTVMNELSEACRVVFCDSPHCESGCRKYEAIHMNILSNECYFCSERCVELGEDEIYYLIYKSKQIDFMKNNL